MRQLLPVLVTSLSLLFFDFGSRMFTTNDEARFPLLARDILTQGHWILPRLNGVPHLDKPPLLAWLIALASWPGAAVTQASAALPSLLAALGVVLSTFWIAWRLFGADAAAIAGLVSITMYGVLTLARAPIPDMTFCAELTAAMAAYVAAEFRSPSSSSIRSPPMDGRGRRAWPRRPVCCCSPASWCHGGPWPSWWREASGSGSTSRETIGCSGTFRPARGAGA